MDWTQHRPINVCCVLVKVFVAMFVLSYSVAYMMFVQLCDAFMMRLFSRIAYHNSKNLEKNFVSYLVCLFEDKYAEFAADFVNRQVSMVQLVSSWRIERWVSKKHPIYQAYNNKTVSPLHIH